MSVRAYLVRESELTRRSVELRASLMHMDITTLPRRSFESRERWRSGGMMVCNP